MTAIPNRWESATEKVLVLGGNGFVGKALQRVAAGEPGRFLFVDRLLPHPPSGVVDMMKVDLLAESGMEHLEPYRHAIWVAGHSDHGIGWVDPISDMETQVTAFLRFLSRFRGSLTMLSSQAVYFGLEGGVGEEVDHVPSMPYGFSKLAAEKYAQWALEAGRLERLWIHRLMYTFGPEEKPRRLLPRCIRASRDGDTVTIAGNGRSYINPLPVAFLARVLARSSRQLAEQPPGYSEVTNINHPEPWTVRDVVKYLCALGPFDYKVVPGGESWPVVFHGRVDRLSAWLDKWGIAFPDVRRSLAKYREEILGRNA